MRWAKVEHFSTMCHDSGSKPRKIWQQLNTVLGRKVQSCVTSLTCENGTLTKATDIVNEFSRHFRASITPPPAAPPLGLNPVATSFHFSPIDADVVCNLLSTLEERKATGLDNISSRLLRTVAPAISESLASLFNACLSLGQFPSEWKCTNITPVPKSEDKHLAKNYRPVSVLPVLAKVFESIVHHQLYEYFDSNDLLNSAQSGFRPSHNTQDVVLKTIDDWRIALDNGNFVGTVMIGLSKAFDTIDHSILLGKLSAYGVKGTELAWFTDYLRERRQRVVLNGVNSDWSDVTRGVPQGSILGSLLFIIFVNDLPDVVEHSTVSLYADDTTLYTSGGDAVNVGLLLEQDIQQVASWIQSNRLLINVTKTQNPADGPLQ